MKSKTSVLRVLYADSEQSADLFYLSGVFVPDPFLAFVHAKGSVGVVNQLEYGRVSANSSLDEVLLLETVRESAAKWLQLDPHRVGPAEMIAYFMSEYAALEVEVPETFPAVVFARLQELGVNVRVAAGVFFPNREIKSAVEAEAIRAGNAASAAGIREAERVLRAAVIDGKRLKYQGRTLTSEGLRCLIDQACLAKGAVAKHTIVAGGQQACDPHEGGHGPLRPNELIIVDVFPRVSRTGYHGDMTRTFLKGRPSDAQRALVSAVQEAQQAALLKVKAGVSGATVHRAASKVFDGLGYVTERRGEQFVGFIHSTGHGLGLEVHESPRVSPGASRLRNGQVVTVEPGLYYPEIGGCRIEDVAWVQPKGCELLSSAHYRWVLR
ncbi:M24 family metallopeptidase [Coraliomargarita akajimensis]|uniref:Peptidase M24 n=1 Tax=Coraliomargarita akajimensis (strain DSM 45221 / IAM 15411 / JCM 23193 / KCTC 12865 / 04OKA010-24) TaxID=583355 RepID=D5EP98_CORAD|nr:Xaa-Pro peptidase family protein [Coraliomargarita akajimensis]ADE55608.1 peptidase M24 [Coraliomargarita akajimensis DSM 45221]